jgi:hypothetical protein
MAEKNGSLLIETGHSVRGTLSLKLFGPVSLQRVVCEFKEVITWQTWHPCIAFHKEALCDANMSLCPFWHQLTIWLLMMGGDGGMNPPIFFTTMGSVI